MSHKDQPRIFSSQSPTVLVGEVTNVIRAQGNVSATGLSIDSSPDSPVVSGIYSIIPQHQIGLMTHEDFSNQIGDFRDGAALGLSPWNSIGAVSLDAVFAPYSTFFTDADAGGNMAHWTEPASGVTQPSSKSLNPFNPFDNMTGISPSGSEVGNDPWTSGGHNIAFALNYDENDATYPNGSGAPVNGNFEKDHFARHTTTVSGIRGVGLKSPMVLTGWGYDTNGNPVPEGTGVVNGLSGIHPEAMWNPAVWKSGPVDIRWNESRGVWVAGAGGNTEIIKFTITQAGDAIGENATACDYVLATVTDVGCTTSENVIGDTGVKIFDDDLCFFNLPLNILIGLKGTAERFANPFFGNTDITDCIAETAAEGACRWVVTGLCCGEEITS